MDMAQYGWKPAPLQSSCLALIWVRSWGLPTKTHTGVKLSSQVITTCLKSQFTTRMLHKLQTTNVTAPILGAQGITQLSWRGVESTRRVSECCGTALVARTHGSITFLLSPVPDVSFMSHFFCSFTAWACMPTQAPYSFNYRQVISSSSPGPRLQSILPESPIILLRGVLE